MKRFLPLIIIALIPLIIFVVVKNTSNKTTLSVSGELPKVIVPEVTNTWENIPGVSNTGELTQTKSLVTSSTGQIRETMIISKDLKIVSEATREKYKKDEIYQYFSGIIDGNDFPTFYNNYKNEKTKIYDIIQTGYGDLFYSYGWTDTFIKLAYSCDIFKENMTAIDAYRDTLKKSLKILYVTDENGENVGIYKDINDVLLSFIAKNLTRDEFLAQYVSAMEKAKSEMKIQLWKDYVDVYIALYNRFKVSSTENTAPDCEAFLKETFPIHLKEFDK